MKTNFLKCAAVSAFILASAALKAAAPAYWAEDGLVRVRADAPMPDAPARELRLETARNETESAQIVLAAAPAPYAVKKVTFSDLTGPGGRIIGRKCLKAYAAVYELNEPTRSGGGPVSAGIASVFGNAVRRMYPYCGLPDPLSETVAVTVPAGRNQPLYVALRTPRGTEPGRYRGTVTVETDRGTLHVPLHAEVFRAVVPDAERSAFSCLNWDFNFGQGVVRHWNVIKNYFGAEPYSDAFFKILASFARVMADHRQNVISVSPVFMLEDAGTTVDAQGRFHFNWTRFDQVVDCYLRAGHFRRVAGMHLGYCSHQPANINCYRLKNNGTGKAVAVFEPYLSRTGGRDTENWYSQYLPALTEHLKTFDITRYPQFRNTGNKVLFDIWIQHICDEPGNLQCYTAMLELVRKYMVKKDPNGSITPVKTLDAESRNLFIRNKSIRMRTAIWVPKPSSYEACKNSFRNHIRAHGGELWNYVCLQPPKPWLNRFVGQPDTTYPLLFWYFAKEHVVGYLHYALNGWCLGWWEDGDTYIAYPDKARGTLMSSVRWFGQRDGMEDGELLRQAEERAPEAVRKLLSEAVEHPAGKYIRSVPAFRALRRKLLGLASPTCP